MKITIELDITDCRDCLFRGSQRGHGECFEYCRHKDSPTSYGNILWGCMGEFESVPKWCPVGLGV